MKNRFVILLMLGGLCLGWTSVALATPQMGLDSGHGCSYCHLDPAGGGDLTADGDAYLERLYATDAGDTAWVGKLPRLLVGYLHILFAVLWFGTILYVHIVLKPAYAAKGLPRGEKLVGVISFWVVGISGVFLSMNRLDSWGQLVETRFGILLLIKVSLYLLMLVSAVFVIKVVGPRLKGKPATQEHVAGEPFDEVSLKHYDGQEGRPCYFAYQGKVYDASGSRLWPSGMHMKRHPAGADLSEALGLAPHQAEVMERLPVVGEYRTTGAVQGDPSTRLFYLVAYMNLAIVFVILFILALWRWG